MKYRSKIDSYISIFLLAVPLLIVLNNFLFEEKFLFFNNLLFLLFYSILLILIYLGIFYQIKDNKLIISNLYRVSAHDISAITNVQKARSVIAAPAFSLNRLEVLLEGGEKLLISPLHEQKFIKELLNVKDSIKVEL